LVVEPVPNIREPDGDEADGVAIRRSGLLKTLTGVRPGFFVGQAGVTHVGLAHSEDQQVANVDDADHRPAVCHGRMMQTLHGLDLVHVDGW